MLKIVVAIRLINRDEQESHSFVEYQDWPYLPRLGDVIQFVEDSEIGSFAFACNGRVSNMTHHLRDNYVVVRMEPVTVATRANFIKAWDEFDGLGFLPSGERPDEIRPTPSI